jgi:hypothetical protein
LNNLKLAILASIAALPFEVVAVPEFGDGFELRVSVMNVAERDAFDNAYRDLNVGSSGGSLFRSLLAVHTVRDSESNRVFELSDLDDIKKLNSLAMMRLTDVGLRLNKMLKTEAEDTEKNS